MGEAIFNRNGDGLLTGQGSQNEPSLLQLSPLMDKENFRDLISRVAALGPPGLVLTAAIGASGYAGAAALTTALATLGGPLGMLGGIAILGLLTILSQAIGAYGFDVVFDAVIEELARLGQTKKQVYREIADYPIPDFAKKWVKDAVESKVDSLSQSAPESCALPLYFIDTLNPDMDKICYLIKATTYPRNKAKRFVDRIALTEKLGNGNLVGVRLEPVDEVEIAYLDPEKRCFISPTNALARNQIYKLKEYGGKEDRRRIEIITEISRGFWFGALKGDDSCDSQEEIVSVVYGY